MDKNNDEDDDDDDDDDDNKVTCLDHVVSTKSFHSLTDAIWIENHYISSDHFPMFIRVI